MADSTWGTIAAVDTIDSVKPSLHPGGVFERNGPIGMWCGAVLDSKRNELQIPAQGGHNGYWGNEVYVLELNAPVPAWVRITNPRYSFHASEPYMDDGSPRAVHSASQIVYAANVDRTLLTGMPFTAPYGNSSSKFFSFNREDNSWAELNSPPAGEYGYPGYSAYVYGGSCYDPVSGCVWVVQTSSYSSTVKYNPLTGNYTAYYIYNNQGYDGMAALSSSRRCMIYINGAVQNSDGTFKWLDLENPSAGWRSPAAVTGLPATGRGSSIVWYENSGAFIAWRGAGAALVKLIPPENLSTGTWQWVDVTPSGSNTVTPTAAETTGTYGRFNIAKNLNNSGRDCLVLLNAATQATYVYKLPSTGI
jgi:hypothetical protein